MKGESTPEDDRKDEEVETQNEQTVIDYSQTFDQKEIYIAWKLDKLEGIKSSNGQPSNQLIQEKLRNPNYLMEWKHHPGISTRNSNISFSRKIDMCLLAETHFTYQFYEKW